MTMRYSCIFRVVAYQKYYFKFFIKISSLTNYSLNAIFVISVKCVWKRQFSFKAFFHFTSDTWNVWFSDLVYHICCSNCASIMDHNTQLFINWGKMTIKQCCFCSRSMAWLKHGQTAPSLTLIPILILWTPTFGMQFLLIWYFKSFSTYY